MKITDVRAHVLAAPLDEPIRMAFGAMRARTTVLVEVATSAGLSGWGESWVNFPPWAWRERVATIEEGLRPLLVGADPLARDALWRRMYDAVVPMARQWGAIGPVMQALSGVDIALWDLEGRLRGVPIAELLGGPGAGRVPAYASGLAPADVVGKARRAVESGFTMLKLKIGFGREADLESVAAVRRAIGPGVALMVDANQAWTPAETLEMGKFLADHDVRWLEEPVPSADERELVQVVGRAGVPIAAGENVYGRHGFARLLDAHAVDIAQPDVAKTGGISEMRAIVALATACGTPWAPHFYGAALGAAATCHCFAALPGGIAVEWDWNPNPLRDALVRGGFDVRDGTVAVPGGPGLGVELDPEAVARFTVRR